MKLMNMKTLAIGAVACAMAAMPAFSSAQRYGNQGRLYRYEYRDNGIYNQTADVSSESKRFRDYFEHNFRWRGHSAKYIPETGYDQHAEHQGRNGEMTLGDAIQNLDEDLERLRAEVKYHGRDDRARDLMSEIMDHERDVDSRVGRVRDWYDYQEHDRYGHDSLSSMWRDLRGDINSLNRSFGYRSRW